MCDYSLEAVKSVKAAKGDKLISTNFGRGTSGFRPAGEPLGQEGNFCGAETDMTAVCLLPGTELAFDAPVQVRTVSDGLFGTREIEHKVARFAKVRPENPFTHHDGLEFPGALGVDPVLVTHLVPGQTVTVIQLPVIEAPATPEGAGVHSMITKMPVPEYVD